MEKNSNNQQSSLKEVKTFSRLFTGILLIQVFLLILLIWRFSILDKKFAIIAELMGYEESSPYPETIERIPDERGYSIGPEDASITIVEFADFQCPYCVKVDEKIKEIINKYPGQIRFVYRHFPLTEIHSGAYLAAISSECAGEQSKFWEMHDLLFSGEQELTQEGINFYVNKLGLDTQKFTSCIDSSYVKDLIQKDIDDGKKYGVDGTPTIFLNNNRIENLEDIEILIKQSTDVK